MLILLDLSVLECTFNCTALRAAKGVDFISPSSLKMYFYAQPLGLPLPNVKVIPLVVTVKVTANLKSRISSRSINQEPSKSTKFENLTLGGGLKGHR